MSSHRKPATSIGAGRRRSARSVERMPMSATSIVAIIEPSSIGEVRTGNQFANAPPPRRRVGGDESFPHIYGALPASAVVEVRRAGMTDGRFHIEVGPHT